VARHFDEQGPGDRALDAPHHGARNFRIDALGQTVETRNAIVPLGFKRAGSSETLRRSGPVLDERRQQRAVCAHLKVQITTGPARAHETLRTRIPEHRRLKPDVRDADVAVRHVNVNVQAFVAMQHLHVGSRTVVRATRMKMRNGSRRDIAPVR